ncbi:DEAD/DEAH box helicase [Arthrobacter globiformis]|uniref:DEAD/DEAH box helicase n=1 Tax=Arthrobacter globiformis TaxID=1665 RepID=UPI001584E220|nr:DEAD/DEAH box helicase family protein [Arthrobacter globiformis]
MTSSKALSSSLWPHQTAALEVIDEYLNQEQASGQSALITMPTGTGKTAVVAAAIENASAGTGRSGKHFLVVAPWRGILGQLKRDLEYRVWERLNAHRSDSFPVILELPTTKQISKLADVEEPTVFVATTAKLLKIYEECDRDEVRMAELFADIKAVFVDEGHYEPAPRWSTAIRSLGCPTILLTATPYRNDQKFFNVHPSHRFRYSHQKAASEGFLRSPHFRTLPASTSDIFVSELVEFVREKIATHPDTRVIIRCGNAESIRDIVAALRKAGRQAIGIHEKFETDENVGLLRSVPNPDKSEADYWVHQFKLVEGVDDPRFRILAFYDRLGTDRSTIQQIGRVLRNPTKDPDDSAAWVVARDGFDVEAVWRNYETFDEKAGEAAATTPSLAKDLLSAQPSSVYYGGKFRSLLDLEADDAWKHFSYPLATRVFRSASVMNLDEIAERVSEEWQAEDREVLRWQYPDDRTIVLPFIDVSNSMFLRTGLFIEATFGFTVLRVKDAHVFVFDTEGRTPMLMTDAFSRETPMRLSRLLAGDSLLTTVSMDNTDLSKRSIRAKTIRAAAIGDLAPDLTDYAYICSVAEGYPQVRSDGKKFRRYLGLSRSRVRDSRSAERTFAEYAAWIDELSLTLEDDAHQPTSTFHRYARSSDDPSDKSPTHILLDVDVERFERQLEGGSSEQLRLDDYANDVINGQTTLEVNGETFTARVAWQEDRGRYEFSCPKLAQMDFRDRSAPQRELTRVINAEQLLRVVPAEQGFMYANGSFVQPMRPDQDTKRFWLLDVLTAVDPLASASSEKGRPRSDGNWDADSVFGLIDQLATRAPIGTSPEMTKYFPNLDMLLCADLGAEIADFIAVQPDRIAFLHAKAGKGSKLSASALHEIVSQAVKNLLWLQPINADVPQVGYWGQDWTLTMKGSQHVAKRLRVGRFSNGQEMWSHARSVITNPNADREVWLVLGAAMSESALRAAVENPTPQLIQIYSLLQTAWSAVSQVGGRLRVFCSP